ncbi:hypothetical protein NST63_13310 [Heyndrickxia sp. FSL W8-0496]|uniref:hypothetical protein n=1 Tax=Heyndrickxia sp. FSL W8-0496 TaxID=2954702 RepID=UPI0030F4C7AE
MLEISYAEHMIFVIQNKPIGISLISVFMIFCMKRFKKKNLFLLLTISSGS